MKYYSLLFMLLIICISSFCQNKAAHEMYAVHDSIKASGFYAEINIPENGKLQRLIPGIHANEASIGFGYDKENKAMRFRFSDKNSNAGPKGIAVSQKRFSYSWKYDWKYNETYPLLILTASDSASHKTLYTGYIFLPEEKKWKLIATRSYSDTVTLKYVGTRKIKNAAVTNSNRWLLRSNGTWKALDSQITKPPVLRHMSNTDSLAQQKMEEDILRANLPKDSIGYEDGVFYQTIKTGTGRLVKVTDTVTVHYKGSLFSDGSVFDQTKQKPATFPLERLIKGWQIGLSHCKVGGKMRLYICSGSAYGIRTRSANIPPNSILVFDVEVLDAKEKLIK